MTGRNTAAGKELMSIVERVEAVIAAKQTMTDDIAAILAEAKQEAAEDGAAGHDVVVPFGGRRP